MAQCQASSLYSWRPSAHGHSPWMSPACSLKVLIPVPLGDICALQVKAEEVNAWQSHVSEVWTGCGGDCGGGNRIYCIVILFTSHDCMLEVFYTLQNITVERFAQKHICMSVKISTSFQKFRFFLIHKVSLLCEAVKLPFSYHLPGNQDLGGQLYKGDLGLRVKEACIFSA